MGWYLKALAKKGKKNMQRCNVWFYLPLGRSNSSMLGVYATEPYLSHMLHLLSLARCAQ